MSKPKAIIVGTRKIQMDVWEGKLTNRRHRVGQRRRHKKTLRDHRS